MLRLANSFRQRRHACATESYVLDMTAPFCKRFTGPTRASGGADNVGDVWGSRRHT